MRSGLAPPWLDTGAASRQAPEWTRPPCRGSAPPEEASTASREDVEQAVARARAAEAAARAAEAERDAEARGRQAAEQEAKSLSGALAAERRERAEEVERLRAELSALADSAERELVRLSVAVARRVVGRELALDPALIVAWAREAIEASALAGRFTIAAGREVTERVPAGGWAELEPAVVEDAHVAEGACEIRSEGKVIEIGADARLDAVAEDAGLLADREAA